MAVTEKLVDADPKAVFAVLADGHSYGEWVVGAKHIRDADADWPAPGSKIHHTVGAGPLVIRDTTKVVEVDEPKRLVLEARVRPTGIARIDLRLLPEGTGTRVVMREELVGGPARHLPRQLTDWAIHRRNQRALERLGDMAAGRSQP